METGCNTYSVRGLARPEAFALLRRAAEPPQQPAVRRECQPEQ